MALLTLPPTPWTSASSPGYSIHSVPLPVFEALESEDLELAASNSPPSLPPLPEFLISEANQGLWRRRLEMASADPEHLPWILKVIVFQAHPDPDMVQTSPAAIVGRIGFHGKPGSRGLVEIGYGIDPNKRRKGHAGAAMRIIVDVAKATGEVKVLRASVVEDNFISRRIVERVELRKIGVEKHERRGAEGVFVLDVSGDGGSEGVAQKH